MSEEHLEVRIGDVWRAYPCSLFSSTPGTNGEWRTADIAILTPTDYQRAELGSLRGKAVIHLGCHIESRAAYTRLMDAGPAFLLMVDTRYPGATPLADGMFPEYTAAIGAVPTLNVAHQGDGLEIALNASYLIDVLQVLECETVELQLRDSNTQCVVVPVDDDSRLEEYIYVLMPMRL